MTIQTTFAHGIRPSWACDTALPRLQPRPPSAPDPEPWVPTTPNTRDALAIIQALEQGPLEPQALADRSGVARFRIGGMMSQLKRDGVIEAGPLGTSVYTLRDAAKLRPNKTQQVLTWLAYHPGSTLTHIARSLGVDTNLVGLAVREGVAEGCLIQEESHLRGSQMIYKFTVKAPA